MNQRAEERLLQGRVTGVEGAEICGFPPMQARTGVKLVSRFTKRYRFVNRPLRKTTEILGDYTHT